MREPPGRRRVAAVLAGSALVALLGACGSHPKSSAVRTVPPTTTVPATTTTTRPTTSTTVKRPAVCPLTGTPRPGGGPPPDRAAIAVKVENLPAARPQWGLDSADLVFEEPVEGGITRFIAVYQCHTAARIEPVRSARFVDADILQPLGKILFAYSGAIQPVVDLIDTSPLLEDVGADKAGRAYSSDPSRYAPHNLETSTSALYSAGRALGYGNEPPAPIFSFGPLPPGGRAVHVVRIDFPLDVTSWTWHPKAGHWYRYYSDTGPAIQGDNVQISAINVVILHVHEYATPYVEDDTGAHENQLILTGSGPAWILRNGVEIQGNWERPALDQPAKFVEPDGTRITLAPGNTWEELVPWSNSVTAST
jgi:hypothetical protein